MSRFDLNQHKAVRRRCISEGSSPATHLSFNQNVLLSRNKSKEILRSRKTLIECVGFGRLRSTWLASLITPSHRYRVLLIALTLVITLGIIIFCCYKLIYLYTSAIGSSVLNSEILYTLPNHPSNIHHSTSLVDYRYHVDRFEKNLRKKVSSEVKNEALAALNVAVDLKKRNKLERAMKLFQHALALDPTHTEVLTGFGEFLELQIKDIVRADHMYKIALKLNPDHSRALANRKRTMPLVEEIDHIRFNRIDGKKQQLYRVPENHPGLRRAMKESYYQHIHHSTAIEGNTMNLAQTRSIVETRMAVAGKSLVEHNEILGLDSALSYVNNTLVNRIGPLTWQDIVDVHERVMGHVDPLQAGRVRTTQVFVGNFQPPAPSDLRDMLDEFIEWLNSLDVIGLHPIELAALTHYKFVYIHPFFDGNGRTSRLLMNLVLMRAGYPPVNIRKEDRAEYYHTLQTANEGDVRPFIRFVAYSTERTLDEYLLSCVENYNSLVSFGRDLEDGRTIIIEEENDDT